MLDKIKIKAKTRDKSKKNNFLRKSGFVPAVLYGKGIKTESIEVNENEFKKAFLKAESQVIELDINGENNSVLIYDTQKDPLTGHILHIDFYKVSKDKKVHTEIALEFTGTSPAVKDFGGVLVINLRQLSVNSLPDKLVPHIEISLDNLLAIGDEIKIKDIKLPDGITTDLDLEQGIVSIMEPRAEEKVETKEPVLEGFKEEIKQGEEKNEDVEDNK